MERVTSADGTGIAYERTGDGPPLVLVHGTSADHTRWAPVSSVLEERFTVYAVDRRGRGASGDADDYALEREFDDVAAVVGSIDEPAVLLGHSFGALCSLEAALRTTALRGLVLYEPPILVADHEFPVEDVLPAMQAMVEEGENEEALTLFFREVAGVPTSELEVLRSAPNWPARVDAAPTVLRETEAPTAYEFDPDRLRGVTTPTLLLLGGESPRYLTDATEAIAAALPNARITVLDGQQHVAMNTAPELFVRELLEFTDELD
jgi:pimeloyl-ACP methyl ester carboxylesterase